MYPKCIGSIFLRKKSVRLCDALMFGQICIYRPSVNPERSRRVSEKKEAV